MDNQKLKQEGNINCITNNNLSSIVNEKKNIRNLESNNNSEFQPNSSNIDFINQKPIKEQNSEESPLKKQNLSDLQIDDQLQNRFSQTSFNPYFWPASIEIAKIHEKASSLGQECNSLDRTKQEIICPCCDKNSEKQPYNWKNVNVTKELSEKYGTAVPLLFEIIKYYALCIIVIFCINGIYSIYTYKHLCDEYPDSCLKMLGFLPIIDDDQIKSYLDDSQDKIFRWLNFSSYIMILVSQILVDLFCDIRENKLDQLQSAQVLKSAKLRTLLISGIPKHYTQEQVIQYLERMKQKLQFEIVDFFYVSDYSKFHDLFEKRTKLYFQCKPLLETDDQKVQAKVQKLKAETAEINQKLHEVSNKHLHFKGKAFITLKTHSQARNLKNMFPKSFMRKSYTVFLSILKKLGCFTESIQSRQNNIENTMMMQWAPEAKEINWQNLGIKNIDKMKLLIFTFVFSLAAAIGSGLCLTFVSKVIPGMYILIFNILVMVFYTVFIDYLSDKKKGKTTTSKAYFIMSKLGFFILIYFVLLPVIYYGFSPSDSQKVKTYSLFILFLVNSGFQFLGIIINGKHRAHASFKKKIEKNPEIAKKYCQKALHLEMQKPEFELEQRMIGVMQLWTYSTIHAFICSYTLLFSLLFLLIIYLRAKQMLFTQYSIYSYKTLSLQRKFLSTYSFCFQFAVLFMFQIANHTKLQRILAGVFFGVVYIGYWIFSRYRSSSLKEKRIQELLKQPLLENEQDQNIETIDSYSLQFNKFLQNYEQPLLEEEIQNSLQIQNPFYHDVLKSCFSQSNQLKFNNNIS